MKKLVPSLVALAAIAACTGSKSNDQAAILERIDTLKTCFPGMYERLDILLDVIETWRLNTTSTAPDPAGLTWSERTDGVLEIDYTASVSLPALDMQITFFNPSGVAQNVDLSAATSLSSAIEIAATALATTAAPRPFLAADWTLREMGTVIFGVGTFTATIGGTGSQKAIERVFTTTGSTQAAGGPPPATTATISTANPALCVTRISMPDLQVDTGPTQQYPQGIVTFTITPPQPAQPITAVVTFNGTSSASISVTGVPTTLVFDLVTRQVN